MARVLTRNLDARLAAVEERLEQINGALDRLDDRCRRVEAEAARATEVDGSARDGHEDKVARLEAMVCRLDERVEKITSTLVEQASRWT